MFAAQIHEPFKNIIDERLGLNFRKMFLIFQFRLQISTIAEFCDYVTVPITCENLVTLQDVRVAQLFEHVDLLEE